MPWTVVLTTPAIFLLDRQTYTDTTDHPTHVSATGMGNEMLDVLV